MKKIIVLLILVLLLSSSVCVHAALLGEIDIVARNDGIRAVDINPMFAWVESSTRYNITLPQSFFPSDIDVTKVIPATSSNFDNLASILTDGIDDYLIYQSFFQDGSRTGMLNKESYWINKFFESNAPDFYGFEITGISLTLNDISYNSPGSNPNGDGIWTDYSYDVTYRFYGEAIPEPTSLLLLGLGAIALRRKK